MQLRKRRFAGAFAAFVGLDAAPPPDMGSVIQNLAQQFTATATTLLTSVNSVVIDLSRLAYISILLIGLFLYFTHVSKRFGKDLITGGVLLAVCAEFVFPWLSKLGAGT